MRSVNDAYSLTLMADGFPAKLAKLSSNRLFAA
jgi:hypothetical protein